MGRGSHQALASDFLECYRFLVDRAVLALINKKQIKQDNFRIDPDTGLSRLDSDGFHVFIHYMEKIFKTKRKLDNTRLPYEVWFDKSVRKFLESARCGLRFRAYRYL